MLIMLVPECRGLVCPETIWSHFWLLQGRDVKTLGNLLGGLGGCFDRFFPRPWALGTRLGATQQPRFRLPQKAQAHPQRRAVPCHANTKPCICHATAIPSARDIIIRVLTRHLCHSLRRRYPKCSVCHQHVSLVVFLSSRAPLRPSCPTPYRLSVAGDIVLSVTFSVAHTCHQPSLVHRCYSAPFTKSFLSTLSSQHAGSWQCCGTSPARPYHTLTSRTKGLSAGPGYLSSMLRILTPFETSIQQSRLVWRR